MFDNSAASALPIREADLSALRQRLLRHARYALPDLAVAEDLVQDTLVDVLDGAQRRRGQSSLVTWAVAILKHKVADWYRAPARRVMVTFADDDADLAAEIDEQFDAKGAWGSRVPTWQLPDQIEERRQMMHVLADCMGHLPAQTRRVFVMREWLGFDNHEITARLGLSADNVRQILHRARMGLRGCMQRRTLGAREAATQAQRSAAPG